MVDLLCGGGLGWLLRSLAEHSADRIRNRYGEHLGVHSVGQICAVFSPRSEEWAIAELRFFWKRSSRRVRTKPGRSSWIPIALSCTRQPGFAQRAKMRPRIVISISANGLLRTVSGGS